MWYGDAITLTGWNEIWLHEGFATWSEWIWSEHKGNKTAQKYFDNLYNTPPQDTLFWTPPPGNPGSAAFVFNGTIYYRGGMTLQALRVKIGDFAFFTSDAALRAGEPLSQRHDPAVHRDGGADLRQAARHVLRRLALPAGQADELVSSA